jgi:hypothetical protein
MLLDGLFVKGIRLSRLDCQSALRAFSQASTQAIAVNFVHQFGLSVDDLDSSLSASWNADSTAIALLLIDLDNLSTHLHPPLYKR